MVRWDLRARGIRDERVLAAMATVPRHRFVPTLYRDAAYADSPLPIGEGQTISQPYIVALMTEALRLSGDERVLEIGTGSGYQAAVLAELGAQVWTIERSIALSSSARARLAELGYEAVQCMTSDGTVGLPTHAPFDRILASGSLPETPKRLLAQLIDGGIFVGPIGDRHSQELVRIVYHPRRFARERLCECRFVPLVGEFGWPR
jgi:protein-L-isoaspartate(D-aspartate) O-methyltransferase